jgi:hypothetical protein
VNIVANMRGGAAAQVSRLFNDNHRPARHQRRSRPLRKNGKFPFPSSMLLFEKNRIPTEETDLTLNL